MDPWHCVFRRDAQVLKVTLCTNTIQLATQLSRLPALRIRVMSLYEHAESSQRIISVQSCCCCTV